MKNIITKSILSFLATSLLTSAFAVEFTPKKPYHSARIAVSDKTYLHFESRKIALGAGYDINANTHIYLLHEFKPSHRHHKVDHGGLLSTNAFLRIKYKFC